MDRRNKRNEETDKKIDYRVKDKGDLKKFNDKNLKKSEGITQMNMNLAYPECGDSLRKELDDQITKFNDKNPNIEDTKIKNLISGTNEKEFLNKTNYNNEKLAKSHSEFRKRIRDRYTVKLINRTNEKEFLNKTNYNNEKLAKSHSEFRKRIRDRYTVKLINSPVIKSEQTSLYIKSKKEDGSKVAALKTDRDKRDLHIKPHSEPAERPKKQVSEETTQTVEKSIHSSVTSAKINTDSKPDRIPEKNAEKVKKKRIPIITTIKSKNGIFKVVHFVDQRNKTPLVIKIPGSVEKKQQNDSKYTDTTSLKFKPKVTVSKASSNKASAKEEKLSKLAAVRKRAEKRRERNFQRGSTPACSIKELPSPPTAVARWAPASAEPQNIPYYEAWINTTLAAISKNSKEDKLAYEKQAKLLRSFQKNLEERPTSPELFYTKFADEKYAGKVKIRQTDRSQNKHTNKTLSVQPASSKRRRISRKSVASTHDQDQIDPVSSDVKVEPPDGEMNIQRTQAEYCTTGASSSHRRVIQLEGQRTQAEYTTGASSSHRRVIQLDGRSLLRVGEVKVKRESDEEGFS